MLIRHLGSGDLGRAATDDAAADLLARAGVHTDMAIPLIARGQIIGVMGLARARNPEPFDENDLTLACELASSAALSIDNAVLHQHIRSAAETLQRSLLPQPSPRHPGLEIAARYQPAQAFSEVGGDWYDVIPLSGDRTALAVGDVMGSGIPAATTMGRRGPPPPPSPVSTSHPPGSSATSTGSPRASTPTSRPACTRCTTRDSAICRWPARAICRRSWYGPRAARILELPTGTPLEWAASPSRPRPSTCSRATSSSCTPTAW
ncbi:hypothetical protein SGLAM104S_05391 [Streptomyces glaucescens]